MDKFPFKKRVLFIGVPDMALIGLNSLVYAGVNIVGVIGPLKTHNTYNLFQNFVKSKSLNFIEYENLSDESFIETIKKLAPDIAVVCSFNNKIPPSFINVIKDGIINIHPSLLPKYRGGNPYSRVIMNGEEKTGVTLHYISEDFDKGDVIVQEECEITPNETMGTLFHKTNRIGVSLLLKTLIRYEKEGVLQGIKQPEGDFVKAPNLKENEMIINYDNTAIQIERLVRGLNPYFAAVTFFRNEAVKIHKVSVHNITGIDDFENGQICKTDKNKVYIKTAYGYIVPEIMQYAGYFMGNCADFIDIVKPQKGEQFNYG